MGTFVSALLFSSLLLAWRDRSPALFVALFLSTIAVMSWLFYADITLPLSLSF